MARTRKKKIAGAFREIAVRAIVAFGGLALLGLVVQADLTKTALRSLMETMKPTGPTNAGGLYEQEMARQAAKQAAE